MTVTMINCANMAATGVLIRGKKIQGDWQVHREGCRDEKDMRRLFGKRAPYAFETYETVEAARVAFNEEMGPGGSAGFEEGEGWDFDRDVLVMPCAKGL